MKTPVTLGDVAALRSRGAARSAAVPGTAVPVGSLPAPTGWFAVARSAELAPGKLVTVRLGDEELVVARGRDGRAFAIDPHCPHLGAHLGGGTVVDNTVRCGFHGFCFDRQGACTATGYGSRPPRRARVGSHPVIEGNGVVLVHAGGEPTWSPALFDDEGWAPWRFRTFRLPGHPLETSENSVDLGHLRTVHGYSAIDVQEPATIDGPLLATSYVMTRPTQVGPLRLRPLSVLFAVRVWGLGVSMVEVDVPAVGVRARALVLSTSTGPGRITLRIGVSVPEGHSELPAGLDRLPRPVARAASHALQAAMLAGMAHDVRQDLPHWSTKSHVPRPVVARGDGPLRLYRRWSQQFVGAPVAPGRVR